jgi:hypothetical protein
MGEKAAIQAHECAGLVPDPTPIGYEGFSANTKRSTGEIFAPASGALSLFLLL